MIAYVDTGAFIALMWRRDRAHERVRDAYTELSAQRARLVTSDPVIGETVSRLRYDAGLPLTLRFHSVLEEALDAGRLIVRESDGVLRAQAFEVLRRYDGLRLSYADAVGAAVAREAAADLVFALDDDFRVMGFHVVP